MEKRTMINDEVKNLKRIVAILLVILIGITGLTITTFAKLNFATELNTELNHKLTTATELNHDLMLLHQSDAETLYNQH